MIRKLHSLRYLLCRQDLLRDIGNTPNVVVATNKPGLLDKLEDLMKGLNLCEKALNDYLETKRLAYPRFYFVSSADLLGAYIIKRVNFS